MPNMVQTPISLGMLTDDEIHVWLDDLRTRPDEWGSSYCLMTQELGAQLMYEQNRRRHNEHGDVPIEQRMLEFTLDLITPRQGMIALDVFNQRSRDDLPGRIGELTDLLLDVSIGIVGGHLATAYPDVP